MARKVPEHIAYRLAQKAKEADKKIREAEKKAKEAEKKAKEAEKKAEKAEMKAEEIQDKAKESEDDGDSIDLDELDGFDDFDDFDDFDEEEDKGEDKDASGNSSGGEEKSDDDLDALLKEASASESSETKVARANGLAKDGKFEESLAIWKELTANEGSEPSNWRGLASVLELRNDAGDANKAKTAREHADRIETQAIADATGRKMEDIIADLLDDGVLNFSAGSDSKE
mgnify:CR=1 FL=1